MEKEQPIILHDSPEAATYRTDIKGWVSRNGLYFGNDEDLARYSGCTHKRCECGAIFEKSWIECETCRKAKREKIDAEKLAKMPRHEWDGETPLYHEDSDTFLMDASDVYDFCEDCELSFDDAEFRLCKPNHPRTIEADDFYDDIPEDGELPDEVIAAIDAFNASVKDSVLSWSPINVVAIEAKTKP